MKLSVTKAAGVVAAVAVLGAGAISTANATTAPSSTTSVSTVTPPLKPGQLSYRQAGWGVYNEHGESGCHTQVPKGWTQSKVADFHARFNGKKGLWTLRIDCALDREQSQAAAVNSRIKALRGTKNFRVLSIVDGTTVVDTGDGRQLVHTKTMTYTYTDKVRGKRLVISRWFSDYGKPSDAQVEITSAGRVQDRTGLHAALTQATKKFLRAG